MSHLITRLPFTTELTKTVLPALSCVRGRRKPAYLPVAESKLYKVTHRRRFPPEEKGEWLQRRANYWTSIKMVLAHCREEYVTVKVSDESIEKQQLKDQQELNRLVEYNNVMNKKIAKIREERELKEEILMKDAIKTIVKNKQAEEEENMIRARQKLQKAIISASHFIPPEKIEEAIEAAIDNPIDYNFAIDLDGFVYEGKNAEIANSDKTNLPRLYPNEKIAPNPGPM